MKNKDLKRRIVEISYKHKLSHLGSCLTAVDVIKEIYDTKKPDEKFVLSCGHAHLAHLVVRVSHVFGDYSIKEIMRTAVIGDKIETHGIHCDRKAGCDVSTGSLGHGIGTALGMALANRTKDVYCLLSDGECREGSVFEALRIAGKEKLKNLKIYINWNGYAAYEQTRKMDFVVLMSLFPIEDRATNMNKYPEYLQGQQGHYKILNEQEYNEVMEVLK